MIVDLNIEKKPKPGDLLVCNENGVFEPVSQADLLKEVNLKLKSLEDKIDNLQTQIKGVSKNTATILKGVLK